MPPSRVFPPVEFCRGTKPIHAANSRPERNTFGSATVVATAIIGPMPGMLAADSQGALVPSQQLPLQRCNRRLDLLDLICQYLQHLSGRVRQARIAIVANNGNQLADIAQALR